MVDDCEREGKKMRWWMEMMVDDYYYLYIYSTSSLSIKKYES